MKIACMNEKEKKKEVATYALKILFDCGILSEFSDIC